MKGRNNQIEFNYLEKITIVLIGPNKHLCRFLNFQNAPLMRCRHCHFPRGLVHSYSCNMVFKIAKILFKGRGEKVKFVLGPQIWFACS